MSLRTPVILALLAFLLVGCMGRPFQPQPDTLQAVLQRAESQTQGDIHMTAAVPSPEETQQLFDLDLYARGIQPVWLEIENDSSDHLRFAPTGLDRDYFSPLEVSYTHRSGRSDAAREAMDRFLHDAAMPRRIPPKTTLSGYVFTHSSAGTKGFGVDLFGASGGGYAFTFFIPVPGFIPDHAKIDVDVLYPAEQQRDYRLDELKTMLAEQPLLADMQNQPGAGRPVNLLLIGEPEDLLHALLRAGWYEVARPTSTTEIAHAQHVNNRVADAVLRKRRQGKTERNELLIWLSPLTVEGQPVWWAQTNQFFSDWLGQSMLDPDVDDATAYLLQDLWYSQGLRGYAWVTGHAAKGDENNIFITPYFTSGRRGVLWLSDTPVSMLETKRLTLDSSTGDKQ